MKQQYSEEAEIKNRSNALVPSIKVLLVCATFPLIAGVYVGMNVLVMPLSCINLSIFRL